MAKEGIQPISLGLVDETRWILIHRTESLRSRTRAACMVQFSTPTASYFWTELLRTTRIIGCWDST